ncbi:hypothetical protein PPL_08691 [Heterostelium album PN500]|uniref:Complex 1 LYR protein domain-containing protein n=1 Tax=Heterostelium pallidum (strain ATCC 26659 / Pp 5 / PN500) TaxID=670386 RepID=D3BJG5_HETP5|nr:hypothetical protein PPL_08691 [Heterostelium album PN500]EFA78045.1 hypothetical protein PPL_08691 [Heterostelium album PN500]|eukprot:XP_020430172.1 hypothetical protein PPL_08691 [Heterostelium album PN500]
MSSKVAPITTSSLVLFRRLLREGLRYPAIKQDRWWRANVRESFRENKHVKDEQEIKILQDKVKSYRFYLKAAKDLQNLLEQYNIGIPTRDRIVKSSQRVGLQVPEWPEERHKKIEEERQKLRDKIGQSYIKESDQQ